MVTSEDDHWFINGTGMEPGLLRSKFSLILTLKQGFGFTLLSYKKT